MRSGLLLGAGLLLCSFGFPTVVGAQDEPSPPRTELPEALEGVDLRLPTQEAFRDWPPESLRNRLYWLPWSPASFERAAMFNRPVFFFLNARWNRSAQRAQLEALQDPEVIEILNRGYLCVLVEADRRPDIAERYRTGSWPVMGLLLPDGHPMISGADSEESLGKPIFIGATDAEGLRFLLEEGLVYWERYRHVLFGNAYRWASESDPAEPVPAPPSRSVVERVVGWMQANFDAESGGFGAAPKYVVAGLEELGWILAMDGDRTVQDMARQTTRGLLASPLRDSRDGGVHRIAVAPGWEGIQYEKLLDRNAEWLRELVFALDAGVDGEVQRGARETARFLTDVLARPGGGFYRGQAADPRSADGGGYWRGETAEAPFIDRLVLSGDNALAGAALLRAGWALDQPAMRDAGRAALDLVLERGVVPGGGVRHVLEGNDDGRRFLETQAEVAFGLVDGYETTGRREYLEAAESVARFAIANLRAADEPILRDHLPEPIVVGLLARPRYPLSGNLSLARAMLRIGALTGREELRDDAVGILTGWGGSLFAYGPGGIEGALAVEEALTEPVVVRVPRDRPDSRRAALQAGPWVLVDTLEGEIGDRAAIVVRGDRNLPVTDPSLLPAAVRSIREKGR